MCCLYATDRVRVLLIVLPIGFRCTDGTTDRIPSAPAYINTYAITYDTGVLGFTPIPGYNISINMALESYYNSYNIGGEGL